MRIRRLKGREDVRSAMISVLLEGLEVNRAVAAVDITTHCQRNGYMARLRSVGCRTHKRDNSKDAGERETHLSRQADLEDRRVRRRENQGEFKLWTVLVIFWPRFGPVIMEINGSTST
jgi:hypothetical protein